MAGSAGTATAALATGPGGHLLGTGGAEGTRGGKTGAQRGTALSASVVGFLTLN